MLSSFLLYILIILSSCLSKEEKWFLDLSLENNTHNINRQTIFSKKINGLVFIGNKNTSNYYYIFEPKTNIVAEIFHYNNRISLYKLVNEIHKIQKSD
jgi:hypothetical protein